MEQSALTIARLAGELALSKKAFDVKILKLTNISSICDYFVIISGSADVHVNAIADGVIEGLLDQDVRAWHKEGMKSGSWILLDYVDVVVHIFHNTVREFYALEKLWGDAPVEELK